MNKKPGSAVAPGAVTESPEIVISLGLISADWLNWSNKRKPSGFAVFDDTEEPVTKLIAYDDDMWKIVPGRYS